MIWKRKITLLVGLVAVVLSVVTVAGPALSSTSGASPIEKALQKTSKATSSRFSFSLRVGGLSGLLPGVSQLTIGGAGAYDLRSKSLQTTLSLGPLGALIGESKPLTLLVTEEAIYLKAPTLAAKAGPGKQWFKFTVDELATSANVNSTQVQALKGTSPQDALAILKGATSVKKLGTKKIHGVTSTQYRVTLDLAKGAEALSGSLQATILPLIKQLNVSVLPVDVWIGTDGYVHRLRVALKGIATGTTPGAPKASVSVSVDLWSYGLRVRVKAPSAKQTAPGAELIKLLVPTG